jgi:hypothetical protein
MPSAVVPQFEIYSLTEGVILNGLQAMKDLAWSRYTLCHVLMPMRARSFGTEVPQDDAVEVGTISN